VPPRDTISAAKLLKPEPEMPVSVAETPLPPPVATRVPPALTMVVLATPPERTISVPPLLTVSPLEVTPDEMKNGEFAEVMMLLIGRFTSGLRPTSNARTQRQHAARRAAEGSANREVSSAAGPPLNGHRTPNIV
jgi:hypothetical protein